MKFVLQPSLEHMARIKIVISLWNQKDVRALIIKLSASDLNSRLEWKTIEESVIEKVTQLSLPQPLKEKVLGFVKPIGLEVSMWMKYNHEHHRVNLSAEVCWTPHGTVDRKRTAEVLVRDENLDISTRYKLACIYCLEDDIVQLWNSMPEDLNEPASCYSPMVSFWSYNMKRKELDNADLDYRSEFEYYAGWCSQEAVEYFLQKLTLKEREESLVEFAKYEYGRYANVLCFLLSEMNEEQQMEVFKSDPRRVLRCFLQWPLQSFFIRIANCMWDFIPNKVYDDILRDIVMKIVDGFKDWNYQQLFREFWQKSPNALKSFIINEIDKSYLLPFLFYIKDKEKIRLISKNTALIAKEKLICSDKMNTFCECSIRDNEWVFLEFCIQECFPSKTEMVKFKGEFEKRMMHPYFKAHFEKNKHKWDHMFRWSDNSNFKYDKSPDEGKSCSSTSFHGLQ